MKSVIDTIGIENTIKRVQMYKKEEDILFDKLNSLFKDINIDYKSKNTTNFINKEKELENRFKIETKNNNGVILILNKNLNKYLDLTREVSEKFKKL